MYSEVFDLQAEVFKALAHPRRLEIIQLLREQELNVSDIYAMLDLPQANISQHLMILRDAQVVATRREGKQILYRVAHPNILAACDQLRHFLIDKNPDSTLASHLQMNMTELLPIVHDPVCQMRVSPKTAGAHTTYLGTEYYFCASGCHKKFSSSPEKYV